MKSIHALYERAARAKQAETIQAIRNYPSELEKAKCLFGASAIPSFIKPHFMSQHDTAALIKTLKFVDRILDKLIRIYFAYPELRPIYGISREMEPYMQADPGYDAGVVIARPDAFLSHGLFRFLEFNCDSPAGSGYADAQEHLVRRMPIMRTLRKHYSWGEVRRLAVLLEALLKCYRQYAGGRGKPQIALVDWKKLRTTPEFELTKIYFESCGIQTVIADPRALKLRRGKLYYKDFRIDLVYRRVIFDELMQKKSQVRDFLKAYMHGKVCVVNPLRSRLAANKAVLSIVTNPAYDFFFTKEENQMISHHIPWTRRVIDSRKFYGDKTRYLTEFIDDHKDVLVLKPAEGYGGRDVMIGKITSRQGWRRTIRRAIRGGERWVVQEFVTIPEVKVPVGPGLRFVSKKININPFLFGGRYAGSMARLSNQLVINVSVGGGLVPTVSYKSR